MYRISNDTSPPSTIDGLPIGFHEFTLVGLSYIFFRDSNGPSAEALLHFHDLLLFTLFPILFGVLSLIFFSLFRSPSYRHLVDHQPREFIWTLLPTLALICLSLPSLSLLYLLDEVGFPCSTSKVQAHQWYWHYENSDLQLSTTDSYLSSSPYRLLNTDTSLSVPVRLVLRFLVTSADVLHSWTVPSWGLKVDAVPGRLNQLSVFLDRPGIFYGQCSEICGSNHSFIPIKAEVF